MASEERHIIEDNVYSGFEAAVGNTPLILLKGPSEATGCKIYGKCEFLNPGGSVKDRAALYLIKDAEQKGLLTPGKEGQVIVEGTAGNTGIGLALVAGTRGYRCVIVIPETQSEEKKTMLRIAGAELVQVPAKPYANPNNYIRISERIAKEIGGVWTNQFDNVANRNSHVVTTGPEIFKQTKGQIDGFCCAIGTGGTLAGTAEYLRSVKPGVKIALSDPQGAKLVRYYNEGELKSEGGSITEGIGQGRITANIEGFKPDYAYEISDADALEINYDLLKKEGLCLGGSSGINVAGAIRLAEELGPGHTIVTVLCDVGTKYQAKMFDPTFLLGKGLPTPKWMESTDLAEDVKGAVERARVADQ